MAKKPYTEYKDDHRNIKRYLLGKKAMKTWNERHAEYPLDNRELAVMYSLSFLDYRKGFFSVKTIMKMLEQVESSHAYHTLSQLLTEYATRGWVVQSTVKDPRYPKRKLYCVTPLFRDTIRRMEHVFRGARVNLRQSRSW